MLSRPSGTEAESASPPTARPVARRLLTVERASAAALAPYGWYVGPPDTAVKARIDYYGDAVQVRTPAEFVGNDDLQLNLVTFDRRPPLIRWMEYHVKHTQTFVPLGGRPFVMVLGAPTQLKPDGTRDLARPDLPDLDTVRAFLFDGTAAVCMKIGTWHEVPFPLHDRTSFVAIVTNETNRNLEEHDEHFESVGGDLQKRQLERRLGVHLEIDLSSLPAA
jgi:ureidoglycolate lyase